MTPEEKAKKLVFKYFHLLGGTTIKDNAIIHSNTKIWKEAKQCALIANQKELNTLARIQEKFGYKDIEVIRVISGEIKELMQVKQSIESMQTHLLKIN